LKKRLITLLVLICLTALLLPLTVSAEAATNGWKKTSEGWTYYQDGIMVTEKVLKIGGVYYGFDWNGIMYDGDAFECDGYFYRAKAGGALYVNQWVQIEGNWFYYGAEGVAPEDFSKIGNQWYFFGYDGHMASDEIVWSVGYQGYYVIDKSGQNSKALTTAGWHQVYGHWYYMYNNGVEITPARSEMMTIGGKTYYFDYNGQMAADGIYWYWDDEIEDGYDILVDKQGYENENGWAQIKGYWYYAEDYAMYTDGIYEIGGKLYLFDYQGRLENIPGEKYSSYGEVYIKDGSGVLLRNEWRKDTIGSPEQTGWAYYNEYGDRVWNSVMDIGGQMYWFLDGIMQENALLVNENGVYLFDANGKGSAVNGWFQDPETEEKMYAKDGQLYQDGIYEIDGAEYAFNWDGYLVTNDVYMGRLFGADGKMIKTPGWKKLDGTWYYVDDANGYLRDGWYTIGGKLYAFYPEMLANTIAYYYEEECWYVFDNNGYATKLTGTGWKDVSYGRIYLENGKPLQEQWKQFGNVWYYFSYTGDPYCDGPAWVGETPYLFDMDGKWVENGWYGAFYAKNGKLCRDGVYEIGGKQYIFDDEGYLCTEDFAEYEDKYYWLNSDGSVKAVLKAGWNQIGSKWYYYDVERGRLLQNALLRDQNEKPTYGFGSDYAMCTGGVQYAWYDYYMFNAAGNILTGWQRIDGKWYYADPDSSDPMIYYSGHYEIDGNGYYFKDGYMQTGTIVTEYGIITTDSNGVVISEEELPDGWTYVDGVVIYKKNGEYPTGWVGNYYVEEGVLQVNRPFQYNGKYYFAGKDGQYLRSGWCKVTAGEQTVHLYAKADGTLCCSEWLKLGNTYYYFHNVTMVADTIQEIDGKYHEFDANGKWLGQLPDNQDKDAPVKPDGWQMINGAWYYYHAGQPVQGRNYIGGVWYSFDYDGKMLSNDFDDEYYYTASGAQADYVGWKQIGGKWYYFLQNHTLVRGLYQIGGSYYFFTTDYDSGIYAPVMVANQAITIGRRLYIFNASGASAGPETGTGWRQCGSDWYYVQDGTVVEDTFLTIGGTMYAFDWNGKMVKNDVYEVETPAGYGFKYFNASGAAVTKAGWHQTSKGWIYVGSNGLLYGNGLYKIGNSTYSFLNGYWIQ